MNRNLQHFKLLSFGGLHGITHPKRLGSIALAVDRFLRLMRLHRESELKRWHRVVKCAGLPDWGLSDYVRLLQKMGLLPGMETISDSIWFHSQEIPPAMEKWLTMFHVDWCLCCVVLVRLRDIFEQRCDSGVSTLVSMWSHANPIQAYPNQVTSLLTKLFWLCQIVYSFGFTCWFLLFWVLFKGLWQETHALQLSHLSAYSLSLMFDGTALLKAKTLVELYQSRQLTQEISHPTAPCT